MQFTPLFDVSVNLYQYCSCNCCFEKLGLGAYHSSVEYNNLQYHFLVNSQNLVLSALQAQQPGTCGQTLVHRIPMGKTSVTPQQFSILYRQLEQKYTNGSYHIFRNNCNHFSNELVGRLVGTSLPNWIFRLTDCLGILSCCLPQGYLNAQWALEDYKRKEMDSAMEYLPIRDRLKLQFGYPITNEPRVID